MMMHHTFYPSPKGRRELKMFRALNHLTSDETLLSEFGDGGLLHSNCLGGEKRYSQNLAMVVRSKPFDR